MESPLWEPPSPPGAKQRSSTRSPPGFSRSGRINSRPFNCELIDGHRTHRTTVSNATSPTGDLFDDTKPGRDRILVATARRNERTRPRPSIFARMQLVNGTGPIAVAPRLSAAMTMQGRLVKGCGKLAISIVCLVIARERIA